MGRRVEVRRKLWTWKETGRSNVEGKMENGWEDNMIRNLSELKTGKENDEKKKRKMRNR